MGTDWAVDELRAIADGLLGSVDIVAEPADLEEDFRAMAEAAMAKRVGGVSLRVWTPRGASLVLLRQVSPAIADLTQSGRTSDEQTTEFATGAWAEESRDYHLCVRLPCRAVGEQMLASRVSLMIGSQVASQALVKAIWTEDRALSTRLNPEVAHYSDQAELASAIQEGLEARRLGDERTATVQLARAVRLAYEGENQATLKLLLGVVDIDDPSTGTVRLRGRIAEADEIALETRSTRTVRVPKPSFLPAGEVSRADPTGSSHSSLPEGDAGQATIAARRRLPEEEEMSLATRSTRTMRVKR